MTHATISAVLFKKLTLAWAVIAGALLTQEVVGPTSISALQLDAATITVIGGMIVTIITALVTGIVTIITALRVGNVATQQAVSTVRIDAMAKDTEAIKGHVNSEKTEAEGEKRMLKRENDLLRESLARAEQRAALLAQAASNVPAMRAVVDAAAMPATIFTATPAATHLSAEAEVLHNIDKNTAATEKNTANTDAAVRELKERS